MLPTRARVVRMTWRVGAESSGGHATPPLEHGRDAATPAAEPSEGGSDGHSEAPGHVAHLVALVDEDHHGALPGLHEAELREEGARLDLPMGPAAPDCGGRRAPADRGGRPPGDGRLFRGTSGLVSGNCVQRGRGGVQDGLRSGHAGR